ncbi:TPM domain-containing protein [Hyella patelloides]|uniref:TPM domain-containing protein n=1 Tax=Hyella patelloides TaxID=1982969 RepID=UPI001C94426F|nr:TPM domain-containing protein [Hyella patelloides]
MKQTITLGFISSIVILTPLSSQALTVEEVTNPRQDNGGWVTDMADILSDATETEINRMINNLEQTNGTEIAVVTVPDTSPSATPKAFATELFNHWGIGKADTDNGVLFLIPVSDRHVEIETGYGIEGILPDAKVGDIIDTKITPQYKQGDFDRGTLDGTSALIVALNSSSNSTEEAITTSDNSVDKGLNWGIFAIVGGMGLILTRGFMAWRQRNKIFVNPRKTKIALQRRDNRQIHCAKCNQPMEKVNNLELTEPQRIAQNLGGASFRGYKCSNCHNEKYPYVILSYFSNSDRYLDCPDCQELTVIRTEETIKEATWNSKGKRLISKKCHCCDYQTEKVISIPRLYSPTNRSKDRSRSYVDSSYVDTSYSGYGGGGFDGGGSSGGDFGGGSSGGGGAGGDW